jgi:hypothetical protein
VWGTAVPAARSPCRGAGRARVKSIEQEDESVAFALHLCEREEALPVGGHRVLWEVGGWLNTGTKQAGRRTDRELGTGRDANGHHRAVGGQVEQLSPVTTRLRLHAAVV